MEDFYPPDNCKSWFFEEAYPWPDSYRGVFFIDSLHNTTKIDIVMGILRPFIHALHSNTQSRPIGCYGRFELVFS